MLTGLGPASRGSLVSSPTFVVCRFLIALMSLMFPIVVIGQGMCGCEHRYGLLMDFFNSTTGSRWVNKAGWGNTILCSVTWYGVTCIDGDITNVSIVSNQVVGTLPSSWWNMSGLLYLYLSSNSLNGSLPVAWGNMSALQILYLNRNLLIGSLPATWSYMSALQTLELSKNSLSGSLPSAWGSMRALRNLYLSDNKLTGSLPDLWDNIGDLQILDLHMNSLSGSIPATWEYISSMQTLYLTSNSLSGSLPAVWGGMRALQHLSMATNSFTGSLSGSWSNMSSLVTLDLSFNPLTGPLPAAWGNMGSLQQLYLYSTSFSGSLPAAWGTMSALMIVYLISNSLTGSLPSSWGNMSALQVLYLYNNSLSGPLPAAWGNMGALQILHLYNNSLNGNVPASWSNLKSLSYLILNSNCLYGLLPAEVRAKSNVTICNTRLVSTRYSCGNTDWAATCRYVRVSDTAPVMVEGSISNTTSSSATRENSPNVTASMSVGTLSLASSTTLTASKSFDTSWSISHGKSRRFTEVTSAPMSRRANSVTTSSARLLLTQSASTKLRESVVVDDTCLFGPPVVALGLGTRLLPLLNMTEHPLPSMAAVVLLQSAEHNDSLPQTFNDDGQRLTVSVSCHAVERQVLLQQPQFGVTLIFAPQLPGCCRFANIKVYVQEHQLPSSLLEEASLLSLIIAPPPNGWVENTPLLRDATIEIIIVIECGPDSELSVVLSVPAPGAERVLGGQVESAVTYSQIASLATVGATSASSLGRLMAVRSMVLCDADSVVGGGVVDLGLTMCEADGALVAARSAVVSNVVLIVAAAALLLALAAAWSLSTKASLRESLLVLCVPSSLLPAWTAVVPSTSASAALLFGRLGGSPCAGTDAVLGLVGAVVALCPFVALIVLWHTKARGAAPGLVCTSILQVPPAAIENSGGHCVPRWLSRALERRWRWRSSCLDKATITVPHETLGVMGVLLEYRVLWYAALDSLGLAVIACVAVVSGLGGASLCRAWTVVALLLMAVQLVVVVVVQPFTTVFACVHAALSLGLTCLGALAQLVYAFVGSDTTTTSLWLVEASGVCSLAVVGVSAVKIALDIVALLRAVRRRVVMLLRVWEVVPAEAVSLDCDVTLDGVALPCFATDDALLLVSLDEDTVVLAPSRLAEDSNRLGDARLPSEEEEMLRDIEFMFDDSEAASESVSAIDVDGTDGATVLHRSTAESDVYDLDLHT